MTTRVRTGIVVLALVGVAAAATSSYVHLRLLADPGYTSFCDVNANVSCTQVYQSRFGSVAGVPVAFGGVFWFVGVLLLTLAATNGPEQSRPNVAGYFVVWSTVGLAVAMYMAYASFFVLQTFCVLCGLVYVSVIGIFFLAETNAATPVHRLPAAFVQDVGRLVRRPVGLALSVAFVGAGLATVLFFSATEPEFPESIPRATDSTAAGAADRTTEFDRWWAEQPRVDSPVPMDEAAVVVVKFNDYQCPACAQTFLAYESIFAKYESSHPGAVRLVTMDYPLDPECNDQSPNGPHGAACEAAAAVRLARQVGEAEADRMERWLYANQATLSPESIQDAVRDIAGIENFETAYPGVIEDVRADIAVGAELPVEATPTFIINGVLLKGGLAPEFFDRAIASELGL